MKARGKRAAKRRTSPLVQVHHSRPRPERPKYARYYALSGLATNLIDVYQGGVIRFALAPGFHIPRRWRCVARIEFNSFLKRRRAL